MRVRVRVDALIWEAAGDRERRRPAEKRLGIVGSAQSQARSAVVCQLVSGESPAVWQAAQRITTDGAPVERAIDQLALVYRRSVSDSLTIDASGSGVGFDDDTYVARLDRLPLPGAAEVERVLLDVAAASIVVATDELVAGTAERLGFDRDDPIIGGLIELVEEALTDELGPLVRLSGDRTAHTAALREGIVLTHVLSEVEKEVGVLTVSFDLAGFAGFGGVEEPSIDGSRVEPMSAEPGHLAWLGPDGWLDRFETGTMLAVRVGPGGAIDLRALPEAPVVDPDLVAAVRQVYEQEVAEPQLPVSGQRLVFGLLATDRAGFGTVRAPLDVLCEAAGLDKRASSVAHDPEIWDNLRVLRRVEWVSAEAGDDEDLAKRVHRRTHRLRGHRHLAGDGVVRPRPAHRRPLRRPGEDVLASCPHRDARLRPNRARR
jgi:hypothetical protein